MKLKPTLKRIDQIKQKYDCKGELIFRTALCNVLQYGQQTHGNELWCNKQKENIKEDHRQYQEEGKHYFISEDLELAIIDCGYELAQIRNWELFEYIQVCMSTEWETPTYNHMRLTIANLCYIIKDKFTDSTATILDDYGVDTDVLAYLELNHFIKEEK